MNKYGVICYTSPNILKYNNEQFTALHIIFIKGWDDVYCIVDTTAVHTQIIVTSLNLWNTTKYSNIQSKALYKQWYRQILLHNGGCRCVGVGKTFYRSSAWLLGGNWCTYDVQYIGLTYISIELGYLERASFKEKHAKISSIN